MINARGGIGKARNGKMNAAGEQETAWSGGEGGFCLGFNRAGLKAPRCWRLERRNPAFPQRHLSAIIRGDE